MGIAVNCRATSVQRDLVRGVWNKLLDSIGESIEYSEGHWLRPDHDVLLYSDPRTHSTVHGYLDTHMFFN